MGAIAQKRSKPCAPVATKAPSPTRRKSARIVLPCVSRPIHFSASGERSTMVPSRLNTPSTCSSDRLSVAVCSTHLDKSIATTMAPKTDLSAPRIGTAALDTQRPRTGPRRTAPTAKGRPAMTAWNQSRSETFTAGWPAAGMRAPQIKRPVASITVTLA